MDNIFIERLWRSVKYEEVYLKDYETLPESRAGLNSDENEIAAYHLEKKLDNAFIETRGAKTRSPVCRF